MGITTTGWVLLVFCVWLRLLLRLPFCELALSLFAFIEGLDIGQEAPGYGLYDYLQIEYNTSKGLWSMDGALYERLKEKEQIMLDAIDNHKLESMPTSEEDLEKIFSILFG